MLKLSSSLVEAATNVAKNMLENDIMESNLPEMSTYCLSRNNICPEGYVFLGEISVNEKTFYLFQMF